jgi:hypothetical protein
MFKSSGSQQISESPLERDDLKGKGLINSLKCMVLERSGLDTLQGESLLIRLNLHLNNRHLLLNISTAYCLLMSYLLYQPYLGPQHLGSFILQFLIFYD